MGKYILTESQAKLLFEEINKNDSIQKLIFSDESDFNFDLDKSSLSELNSISVSVNGKKISKKLVDVKYKEETINSETCYVLVIIMNDKIRRYGIAKKIVKSFAAKYGPVAIFYNIVNGKIVKKFANSLNSEEHYSSNDIKNKNGDVIGSVVKHVYTSNFSLPEENIALINESKVINESIANKVFYGCKSREDRKNRLISLAKRGVFSAWVLLSLIAYVAKDKHEQEEIKNEIEVVMPKEIDTTVSNDSIKPVIDNTIYATDFKISSAGIEHIKNYEKLSLLPYFATNNERKRGIQTIGYGHKILKTDPEWIKSENGITEKQAEQILRNDIASAEVYVSKAIRKLPNDKLREPCIYPQSLMDVMISMMFNGGWGNFTNLNRLENPFYESLKKCRIDTETGKIRKDDYDFTISKIPHSIVRQGGSISNGLVNRRNTEYHSLFKQ